MLRRFFASWKVRLGTAILLFFVLMALFGEIFVRQVLGTDPGSVDYEALAQPPSAHYPLGTNMVGQDVLSQVIIGARGSVFVGFISGTIAVIIGVLVGTWSGYSAGLIDRVTMAVVNVLMTLPSMAVLFILAGYVRDAGLIMIAVVIGVLAWPGSARAIRAQTLSLRNRDFTTALRGIGESRWRIIVVEIIPHLGGIISAMFLTALVGGIMAESGLAFLGIGNTGGISWGLLIGQAQQQGALLRGLWWWFLPPGVCIALIGFATALVNFGLDEVTNPALDARLIARTRRFATARRRELARERRSEAATTPRAGTSVGAAATTRGDAVTVGTHDVKEAGRG
ncbi:ABC transporter permease [Brachybacterium paraconglomeratum]|uniref:ABC transporter permease n=1 Tax=Brachybacterium paraconglomeratum TaxID=173362 RepID=UPI003FD0FC4F